MKNLAIALCGLIIVLLAVFLFTAKHKFGTDDLAIPSQVPIPSETPKVMFNNESTAQASKVPFPVLAADLINAKKATIQTEKGNIVIQFFGEAPLAASNFIYLADKGFYNGLKFHRREEGFVIQGGDPNGNGTGGPGYSFADERVTRDYKKGIVAMANSGPNTNGSQFFIMLADTPQLPKQYTIFGQVIEGQDVVDQIAVGDVMQKVTIE